MPENTAQALVLPRKSKFADLMRLRKVRLRRTPVSMPQRNSTRVPRMAENMEATMPMVRVMAKPRMLPLAIAMRMMQAMSVVRFASRMDENAFS